MATPWGQKRRVRIWGASDLDMKMHISSPILLQKTLDEKEDDEIELTIRSDSPTYVSRPLPNRSNSSTTRLQFLDFATEPPVPRIAPVSQKSRGTPSQLNAQNRSVYSIYPTPTSSSAIMAQGTDLPLRAQPQFSRARDRGFSEQSSATVQIGLRLSYLGRALDREPTSPSLHLPLQLTSSPRPSSRASSILFTQPMGHYVLPSNEELPVPAQPEKVQIVDQAIMARSNGLHSRWPIPETVMDEPDHSIIGTTKPLPPVPLNLRNTDPQSKPF